MTNFLYPIHFYTTYWQLWQPFWTPQASRVLGTAWDLKGAAEKGAASNDGTFWTTGIVSRTLGAYQWGVRSPENRVTASDLRVVSKPNSISNLLFKSVLFLGSHGLFQKFSSYWTPPRTVAPSLREFPTSITWWWRWWCSISPLPHELIQNHWNSRFQCFFGVKMKQNEHLVV